MRIHKNSQIYLKAFVNSLEKDPVSFESWNCLHFEFSGDDSSYDFCSDLIYEIKNKNSGVDCDIIHCEDNDILFISKELNKDDLYDIEEHVTYSCISNDIKTKSLCYDLFMDWRIVKDILLLKIDDLSVMVFKSDNEKQNIFGEISSLQEIFDDARKLRKVRNPIHIMIVDDDPITRRVVSNSFKENYALVTAENAREAIANYLTYAPDIVFLDIGLPDVNGFEVLYQIMKSDPDAYVVMFSANSHMDNITSSLLSGASGFVSKPFSKEKMRHYIEESADYYKKTLS
ncbi:MAG: response regulator [Rickettsiales bacterium]